MKIPKTLVVILSVVPIALCSCTRTHTPTKPTASEQMPTSALMLAADKVVALAPSGWTHHVATNITMQKYFWEGSGTGVCVGLQAEHKTYTATLLGQETEQKAFLTIWIMPASFNGQPSEVHPESIDPPQFFGKNQDYEVYLWGGGLWPDALEHIRRTLKLPERQ